MQIRLDCTRDAAAVTGKRLPLRSGKETTELKLVAIPHCPHVE